MRSRRLLVKTREGTVRADVTERRLSDAELASYLVHQDGFLNVPVLVLGDLLVRGYTPELYHEALTGG
jgi:arsenate reductase-like glutaredoxin family protein